jgi:hypothetical protein
MIAGVIGEPNDLSDGHRFGAHESPSTLKVLHQIVNRGQAV